jgi:type II secretory pathway component GspD/PulD (secretin)
VGNLFQSQSKQTQKKNLMIFVTATIVDPAGNRVHTDDDLPFAQAAIPPQPPGLQKISPPAVKE